MPDALATLMDLECRICMNDPCNIVLVPCNHLCMCVKCFKEDKKRTEEKRAKYNCPMCKQEYDPKHQILIIYDGPPVEELNLEKRKSSKIVIFKKKEILNKEERKLPEESKKEGKRIEKSKDKKKNKDVKPPKKSKKSIFENEALKNVVEEDEPVQIEEEEKLVEEVI
jgi:hypothetical protein